MIAYASVYGHTENTANILSCKLREKGIRTTMFDVSVASTSEVVAASFEYSHLVFASTTYNAGIFITMDELLRDIASHNLQNRTVAFIENGSWAATSGKLMREIIGSLKNMTIIDKTVSLKSALSEKQLADVDALADAIADTMPKKPEAKSAETTAAAPVGIDNNAMFKLSYGLFVLSAKDGDKTNGCIINTVTQVTDTPKRISIAVNKNNLTHDMILKTGEFNVSVLSEAVPFKVFQHFGFQSGRSVDKFADYEGQAVSSNGIPYLTEFANSYISAKVIETQDYGTHTLFVADVTEAQVLSDEPSVTYAYYFAHIKPKPAPMEENKKGFVCKICGYVYESDELPADFICPLCKHGAEDFEAL
jgi:flavin reductase (DIM6/NTAB) family NADH-FMN oxidoreductase RutF/flavodoxin